jgi:type I restriction enzyme M protein
VKSEDLAEVRRTLWKAADELRANSTLTPADYRGPVLGLIFLAYAEHRFEAARPELEAQATTRNPVSADDYRARSVLFVPDQARLSGLVDLPEGEDLGAALDAAIKAVETANPELRDVLPRGYERLARSTLTELLRLFSPLPRTLSGDAFGLIYEDFLSNFAMAEGRLGGEFFTPYSIVRLIVEIIEPFHGKVYDPACGSGGMFVQCAKFVERHAGSATRELSIYGQEQKEVTVPLAKMNLALHGLSGDIRLGNSYYDDLHHAVGRFDFVMANPPFNVNGVDKDKLAGNKRFPFGLPKPDNGNYLWIQQFYAALNDGGRAGFVMANSAGDADHSEKEIRRQLVESGAVDVMVAIGTNFFYTVTLPVTLWFLDKGKAGTGREDTVLFIDARHLYRQIDRAHRDFLPEQSWHRHRGVHPCPAALDQCPRHHRGGVGSRSPIGSPVQRVVTVAVVEADVVGRRGHHSRYRPGRDLDGPKVGAVQGDQAVVVERNEAHAAFSLRSHRSSEANTSMRTRPMSRAARR